MIGEGPGCAPAPEGVSGRRGAQARLSWLALLTAVLSALAPKCPLCLVAYLSAFGVTLGVASFALALLRPLAVVLTVLALAVALRQVKIKRRPSTAPARGLAISRGRASE